VAVVVADVDGFSAVTDALGVEMGDLLLEAVAERLASSVRGTDVVKSLGGDEFGVLLVGANQRPVVDRWIARLRDSLAPPLTVGGRDIGVTLSMGIAVSEPGRTARGLLSAATLAMRRAKERGPGSAAMYEPEMHTVASRRFRLGSALRKAVQAEQLSVHYQPIVDLRTGRLSGFEALCRWRSDELGPVPPATFIPLAEQLGLIDTLDSWVLRQSCTQLAAWNSRHQATAVWAGQPLPIMNVNVSGRRFCAMTLVDSVLTTLRDVGLPPAQLRLEITESALLDDPDAARRNIARLRTHGVTVSIDDFGTGYSSLSYLSQLPVAGLKIDRSFVASLERSPRAPIVRTVLALARELGMGVTAEGVETREQLVLLQELRCDRVQGYLLARPAVPAAMSPFLDAPAMLAA